MGMEPHEALLWFYAMWLGFTFWQAAYPWYGKTIEQVLNPR